MQVLRPAYALRKCSLRMTPLDALVAPKTACAPLLRGACARASAPVGALPRKEDLMQA